MALKDRKRLGDLLLDSHLLTEEQLNETLSHKQAGQKLGDALLEKGLISEQQLIEVLEFQLGIPHVSLAHYPIDPAMVKLVSHEFAREKILIPLKKDGHTLHVAMNDPMDYFTIDDLSLSTGFQIAASIAAKDDILQAVSRHYTMQEKMDQYHFTDKNSSLDGNEPETPAIEMVDQILAAAVQKKASDIHFDPQEDNIIIRFRIDGLLQLEGTLPKTVQNQLIARIKILANLNITESRLPQDGRIKMTVANVPIDLRIATLPTVYGEKVVVRILDLSNVVNSLSELGFNDANYKRFLKTLNQPSGLVLLTGPTGSGKTSTLYAALDYLNQESVNIITIEDPVEYQIAGINQVHVNPKIGLTFAAGLRSILRQDPNIVMVGEIRDKETAEIAIRASLTGHQVFSTLHTNNAMTAVPRLFDMGIEPFLVVSSLSCIVAQRLVRKTCPRCSESYDMTEMEKDLFVRRGIRIGKLFKGRGCAYCNKTGYSGRLAIQEVLTIDEDIRREMMNNKSLDAIRELALRKGMSFLIDDGLLKVKQGVTTIEEVLRVAQDE